MVEKDVQTLAVASSIVDLERCATRIELFTRLFKHCSETTVRLANCKSAINENMEAERVKTPE